MSIFQEITTEALGLRTGPLARLLPFPFHTHTTRTSLCMPLRMEDHSDRARLCVCAPIFRDVGQSACVEAGLSFVISCRAGVAGAADFDVAAWGNLLADSRAQSHGIFRSRIHIYYRVLCKKKRKNGCIELRDDMKRSMFRVTCLSECCFHSMLTLLENCGQVLRSFQA